MKALASITFLVLVPLAAQTAPATPPALTPEQIKAIQGTLAVSDIPAPTMLPKTFVSAGAGYASPGGSFAYVSFSTLMLPQNTYLTTAQEYTMQKGQVQSCTFAGVSKPLYQLSVLTIGLTGLGGGCNSTNGDSAPAGSGQGFLDAKWGKLPISSLITVMKNTTGGWKATIGFSWGKYQ